MAKLQNIPKQAVKPIDSYLKFVQQSFNTGGADFKEILKQLNNISKIESSGGQILSNGNISSPVNIDIINEAKQLASELLDIPILLDLDKYKKFDKLGNFGLSDRGLIETYKVSEDIIKDINTARNWLKSYKKFQKIQQIKNKLVKNEDLHSELLILGQSILARAIEKCPMKTGTLRSSGFMLDMGDHVIVGFSAPYASYVHENMNIAHPIHGGRDCGGESKFLEKALQEFFPDKTVWTEVLGHQGVYVKIGINPLWLEYGHYG